ncbi:condensation domain-containing protein [Pseudomonas aeruginosa]|nr:condensation domain-containing protein [Pseudomonas aeruginosa]
MGRFDRQFDGAALLVPATESAGAAQDPCAPLANWLSIEGQVYGGELSLHWSFSREMFAEATVQRLVDDYARELHALIEHCLDPRHRGVTPSDFPLAGLSQTQLDELSLDPDSVRDIYPLSPMQQGMLFHSLHGTEGDYVNQLRMDIGGLDPDRFRAAWQATLDAHEILRSGFLWKDGWPQPLQVVFEQATLELRLAPPGSDPQRQAEAEREAGFDPARAPLQRLVLVPLANGRMHLIYTYHHILMDGWSNAQLLAEVLQRYAGQEVAATVGRYRDYIGWLQGRDAMATEFFWRDRLASLEMPTRLARQARTEQPGQGEHLRELDPQTTRQLASFAQGQKVTLNTLVQAAWALLLQRHCGQGDGSLRRHRGRTAGGTARHRGADRSVYQYPAGDRRAAATAERRGLPAGDGRRSTWRCANTSIRLCTTSSAGPGMAARLCSIASWCSRTSPWPRLLRQAPADLEFSTPSNHEQTNYPLTLGVTLGERLSLQYVYARRDFDAADIAELDRHLLHLLQRMAETPRQRWANSPCSTPGNARRRCGIGRHRSRRCRAAASRRPSRIR